MTVKIRPITLKDSASYWQCRKALAKELRYSIEYKVPLARERAHLRKRLRKKTPFLVGVDDARVIGAAFVFRQGFPSQDHLGDLGLFILPEYRGKGLEAKLVAGVLKMSQGKFESVTWWFVGKNRPARALAKKLGFERAAWLRKAVKMAYGFDDLLIMQKRMHGGRKGRTR